MNNALFTELDTGCVACIRVMTGRERAMQAVSAK